MSTTEIVEEDHEEHGMNPSCEDCGHDDESHLDDSCIVCETCYYNPDELGDDGTWVNSGMDGTISMGAPETRHEEHEGNEDFALCSNCNESFVDGYSTSSDVDNFEIPYDNELPLVLDWSSDAYSYNIKNTKQCPKCMTFNLHVHTKCFCPGYTMYTPATRHELGLRE